MSHPSRRSFVCTAAGALAAGIVAPALAQGTGRMDGGAKPAAAPGAGRIELPMREFGRTGMKVRVLGLGTLQIGIEHADQDTATKVLNTALDEGCNVIDTAECYMKAETLIGNAVAHRRKDYFLFTKVGHVLNDDETTQWAPEWDEPGILKSVDRSLRRLKTDHLDLVHLHSCGPRILERGEAIGALEKAKQAGKVRFLGYSGDHRPALWALDSGKFDSLMTSLSVADQESIDMLLPVAREKKIGVIIKRPIANAAWRHESADPSEYHYEYWRRLRELKYDFLQGETRDKPGPEGGAGVAMRFTLAHPIDLMIVGSSNPARFRQNAEIVAAGPLPAAQVNEIRARWKQVAQPNWFGQI